MISTPANNDALTADLNAAPDPEFAPFQVTDQDAVRSFIDALETEFPQKSREEIEAAYLDACTGTHQGETATQIRDHIRAAIDNGADRVAPIV